MSNLLSIESQVKAIHANGLPFAVSIDINIPPQLHQEPVLAKLISNYDIIVNFKAALLDRKATDGGWFNLTLEGNPEDIERALNYLRNLEIEIFAHGVVPTATSENATH
jgi:NIL domain